MPRWFTCIHLTLFFTTSWVTYKKIIKYFEFHIGVHTSQIYYKFAWLCHSKKLYKKHSNPFYFYISLPFHGISWLSKRYTKIIKCFGFHIVSEHCFDTLKKVIENHRWAIVFYHTNTQIHSRDFTNNSQHSNDHPYNIRVTTKTPIGYIP